MRIAHNSVKTRNTLVRIRSKEKELKTKFAYIFEWFWIIFLLLEQIHCLCHCQKMEKWKIEKLKKNDFPFEANIFYWSTCIFIFIALRAMRAIVTTISWPLFIHIIQTIWIATLQPHFVEWQFCPACTNRFVNSDTHFVYICYIFTLREHISAYVITITKIK